MSGGGAGTGLAGTGLAGTGLAGTGLMSTGLAGVVLAAGEGRRLRPLTDATPKALVEVGGVPLLDGALDRLARVVGAGPEHLAVNAHHHADQVVAAVGDRAHVSVERPRALGTAGALAALAGWLGGRPALVTNADVWMPDGTGALAALVAGWDGERCRLLCAPAGGRRTDFTTADGAPAAFLGTSLVPAPLVGDLARRLAGPPGTGPTPSGLHEALWRALELEGRLDLHVDAVVAVDCGTPADLERARGLARAPAGGSL